MHPKSLLRRAWHCGVWTVADIDLIPQDYRNWLTQRSVLRKYLSWFVAINLAILAIAVTLNKTSGRISLEAAELKSQNAITQQQQIQLEQLQQQSAEYQRQLGLLRGLRAGAAVDEVFATIDRALTERDLWFLDWKFRRAGVVVDGEPRSVETGYFVIVDASQGDALPDDLKVATHMTIRGQAKDHQALSTFVRALFDQSAIKDVNVQKTSSTNYGNGRVVEFDMTITLNSAVRDI